METLAPVDLDLDTLRKVVEKEGGCVAWGGAMHLSPADDIFVRIERELDIDTQGQLIARCYPEDCSRGGPHRDRYSGWANRKSPQPKLPSILRITFRKSPRHLALYCVACLQTESACRQRYRARRWRRATCWPYCATRRMRRKTYVTAWRWWRAVLELGGVAKGGIFGWLMGRSAVAARGKNFRRSARLRGFVSRPKLSMSNRFWQPLQAEQYTSTTVSFLV